MGFAVAQTNRVTNTPSQVGTVISQSPPALTKQAKGSTVTIVVGSAPTTASVQNVVGYTASAAVSTLTGAGFKVAQQTQLVSNPAQNGNVIDQSPRSGTANKGTTVTIIVGKYVPPTTTTTTTTPPTTTTGTTTTTTTTTTPAG